MKFTCDRTALTEAVSIVQRAVATRSTITALEGIMLKVSEGKVTLTGNDLEIGIECIIGAEDTRDGKVVVNSTLFGNAVRKMAGAIVTMEMNDNNVVKIKHGQSMELKMELGGIDGNEFPEIQRFDTEFDINLSQREFKDLVRHTIFAVGTSEAKLILTGCLLEASGSNVNMVAVDGFRLALKKIETEADAVNGYLGDVGIVIPSKTLKELTGIIDDNDDKLIIKCSSKNIRFEFDNVIFTSRLLEGDYIDYKKIIPSSFGLSVTADIKPLIDAVDRASIIINSEMNKAPVIVRINDGMMNIYCETSAGKVDEVFPVESTGEEIEIGFNNKYLLEALKASTGEKLNMQFIGPVNPCLITPFEGDSFKFIVLPVRLKSE